MTRAAFRKEPIVAVILAIFALVFAAGGAAHAAGALSDADKQCLACHSSSGLTKKLSGGDTLSLHIAGPAFAASVHNAMGCASCHADVSLKSHPPAKLKTATAREYSIARLDACRQCHDDKFKLYDGSIHATLLRDGNPIAPVCTDCHAPHSVRKADHASIAEVPCRKCHDAVFNAYAGSVHGQARSKPGASAAPLCADCHRAHDVTAATTGDRLKDACLGCHAGTVAAHQAWLPNAERHLDAIACPACHVPEAQRRVDLRLYDKVTQERSSEKLGVPQFESRVRTADAKGAGLDALALQSLLREFSRDGTENSRTILRGRLELRNGVEAHQLADKSKAIRTCDTCHRQGAAPFQSVTVSIVGPDGRPLRYGAQKDVLNSVISVDSVGGFYAIGATRIKLLDILLVLALLSGVCVPLGHMTLKWLFKKYRVAADTQHIAGSPQVEADTHAVERPAVRETPQQKE